MLAHLQVVVGAKLRRDEVFFLSWRDDPALGDGRSSIWIEASIPLKFTFATTERHELNREWLDSLVELSNHPQGLLLTTEPGHRPQSPKSRV